MNPVDLTGSEKILPISGRIFYVGCFEWRRVYESENIAMIAAYMDYLMNLEENASGSSGDNRPISRWREFGLQKGVLRI